MSFFKAINQNNVILVKKLIECGADINAFNKNSVTPLIYACDKGRLQIVKHLVEHGADVNQVNEDHVSALATAYNKGRLNIAKYLVENTGANWFGDLYNKDLELLRK